MYLVKLTSRKNDNASFFEDRAFNAYQTKMYQKKWKHEHCIVEGNVQRYIFVWPNEEAYQTWYDDPTVTKHRTAMEHYNSSNEINLNEIKLKV